MAAVSRPPPSMSIPDPVPAQAPVTSITQTHPDSPRDGDLPSKPNASTTATVVPLPASTTHTSPAASTSPPQPQQPPSISVTNSPRAHHHASSSSVSLALGQSPKTSRSGSLLAFATAAIDRTQSALASAADLTIRPRQSLSRLSLSPDSLTRASIASSLAPVFSAPSEEALSSADNASTAGVSAASAPSPTPTPAPTAAATLPAPRKSARPEPFSTPYDQTDPNHPLPIHLPRLDSKMHQTSSRLLRMTDDDRPFTKDFKDLFATLIVSLLPLSAHRVRLSKVDYTFLSEDGITNLGSLKFSQSNRMPDPKDPSRIVTTTTTTTFSMARDMARSICQRFLEARFIESADGKYQQVYSMKGSVWQLTPKGIAILDTFCARNGIQEPQVAELTGIAAAQLLVLERDSLTDKLVSDRGTIEVIFRRFIGINGLNVKSTVSAADSDSLNDYRDGLVGVKIANERKVGGRSYRETFTGKAAIDWLMDCSTTVDRREAISLATLFVEHGLVEAVQIDRAYLSQQSPNQQQPSAALFQPTKTAIFQLSARARDLVSGTTPRGRSSESDGGVTPRPVMTRDSNTQRLDKILNDAALRLLFRENLRDTHCEENLSFYLDVDDFVRNCRQAIRAVQKNPSTATMDGVREIMAQAYGIYNAFLAPGSPCELNIDHQLRNNLATRMTRSVGQDSAMIETLREVTGLFEDAQNVVFKLMASDSVPKFLRHPKYEHTLRNYDFDAIVVGTNRVERTQSHSTRK